MKVTFVNYYYDKDIPIDKYLDKYAIVRGWCKALTDLGLEVQVYHRFNKDYSFNQDGTSYSLINDRFRNDLQWYQIPHQFHKKILNDRHEIFHINSFNYSYQAYLLKRKIPNAKVVIQHHAENPKNWLKRILIKKFTSSIEGFIFSSEEIYNEWREDKILPDEKYFDEIIEGSTNFKLKERIDARFRTNISGNPVFLWVGRLNENKDPITVLKGFLKLLMDFPNAKLYMIYSENKLEEEVKSLLEKNTSLKNAVTLIGFVEHNRLENYFKSADYFVLGSHYEGSGFSLLEAMSCGVIPIVTNIPAFRMMTNQGKIGTLWKCGDANSFYEKVKILINQSVENESVKTTKFFNENLSYSAIGKKAKKFYEKVLAG